ncbi:MAG: DUF424 family protein [Candidatus Bathyarchaeota archaeon]|nr:DUF424 family protein [Candidatus Bathyarchaeota archaeon]
MEVYVNLRKSGRRVLLAVCDMEVLGKQLKQGQTRFHISEKFYKGPLVSVDEAIDLIQQSTIINIVGSRMVRKAIEKGLVHPDAVIEIDGVLHAQIIRL